MKIIKFEKKKIIPLRNKQQESYGKTVISAIFVKEKFEYKYKSNNNKNYWQVKDHCHYAGKYRCAAHIICDLKYSMFNKVPVCFHNELNYAYNFIMKELGNQFEE